MRPELRLRVPADEDSAARLCRQALRSLGETVDAEVEALEDAELAVTEALANAVEHAYEDGKGEVRGDASARASPICSCCVADSGVGMPGQVRERIGRGADSACR